MNARLKLSLSVVSALVLASAFALVLYGCSSQQASSSASSASSASASGASSSASASASSSAAGSTSESASSASGGSGSQAAADGDESVVTIDLDYNAGTGYVWSYAMQPEDIVAFVDQTTTEEYADDRAGGPLQDHFTFQALAPGEVEITFTLARVGEAGAGEPGDTQVYAFTVTDDLKMVLNPYKSLFDHEPTWGSNS